MEKFTGFSFFLFITEFTPYIMKGNRSLYKERRNFMKKIIITMIIVTLTMVVMTTSIVPHKVHISTPQGEIEYSYIIVGGEKIKLE